MELVAPLTAPLNTNMNARLKTIKRMPIVSNVAFMAFELIIIRRSTICLINSTADDKKIFNLKKQSRGQCLSSAEKLKLYKFFYKETTL